MVRNHPHPIVLNLSVSLKREVNTQELKKEIIKNDCSAMTITGDVFRKHYL